MRIAKQFQKDVFERKDVLDVFLANRCFLERLSKKEAGNLLEDAFNLVLLFDVVENLFIKMWSKLKASIKTQIDIY